MRAKTYAAFLLFLFQFGYCISAEYHVDRKGQNLVKFISDAPLDNFEGTTDNVDGYIVWDGDNPVNNSEFHFEAELSTLDTGIGLRNRHMRENYLETDKYPWRNTRAK
jgi:polyisoprenoid-binding protein YceI